MSDLPSTRALRLLRWGALRALPQTRLLFLLSLTLSPSTARALPATAPAAVPVSAADVRSDVARAFAPTFFQETDDRRDLLTAFDFDGDWDGSNNRAHLDGGGYPLRAVVYTTTVETPTHFLVTYVLYHPIDAKWRPVGHDHDTEHVTLVIRKPETGRPSLRLEMMETRFHKVLYQYAAAGARIADRADNVDGTIHDDGTGHPSVMVQRVGHGLCGGFAPRGLVATLALGCHHAEAPRIARQGVVYRHGGVAGVPRSLDDRDVSYALVEIGDTLWAHAHVTGPHATFSDTMDFRGARCARFTCPHGIGARLAAAAGRGSTGMPWEEGAGKGASQTGEAFFDPAYVLSRRLTFTTPFSVDYVYNPYLGVGAFASSTGTPLSHDHDDDRNLDAARAHAQLVERQR